MQMKRQIQPRIFLSYAHADKAVARNLVEALQRQGADVWVDEEQLAVGDSLIDRIEAAIRGSDLFLVLVSPASERSGWLGRELGLALKTENRTRVVPILLPGAAMPSSLQGILYLEADPRDFRVTAEKILRASHAVGDEKSDAAKVERILAELGVDWQSQPSIAGVRPDFLVEGPDGKRIVIELKGRSNPGLLEAVDARSQAVRIRDLTAADAAVVVVPRIETALPDAGIVGLADLRSHMRDLLASPPKSRSSAPGRPEPATSNDGKTIFASMPFKPQYEDVYWFAMAAAAEAVGATCLRVDREDFDGDIPAKIASDIESAVAVIGDLSESNPDVLYEIGYARKQGTPCVHICSTPLENLPFNVRNVNTLSYRLGQIHALREPLIKRLKAVLDPD
jgi:hypothetical protein